MFRTIGSVYIYRHTYRAMYKVRTYLAQVLPDRRSHIAKRWASRSADMEEQAMMPWPVRGAPGDGRTANGCIEACDEAWQTRAGHCMFLQLRACGSSEAARIAAAATLRREAALGATNRWCRKEADARATDEAVGDADAAGLHRTAKRCGHGKQSNDQIATRACQNDIIKVMRCGKSESSGRGTVCT
jgi:hypothetical protein